MVYSGTRVPKMAMCRARITPSLEPEVSLHRIYTSGGNSGCMADIAHPHRAHLQILAAKQAAADDGVGSD